MASQRSASPDARQRNLIGQRPGSNSFVVKLLSINNKSGVNEWEKHNQFKITMVLCQRSPCYQHDLLIYIERDWFVMSQLFSVARPARCFKLGSKPGWLYVSRISYSRLIVILYVTKGFFFTYLSKYMLTATRSAKFLRIIIQKYKIWQNVVCVNCNKT